jgi:hypothetical protein
MPYIQKSTAELLIQNGFEFNELYGFFCRSGIAIHFNGTFGNVSRFEFDDRGIRISATVDVPNDLTQEILDEIIKSTKLIALRKIQEMIDVISKS